MDNSFMYTARFYENGVAGQKKYFSDINERDEFVKNNPGWKKRGKICAQNLQRHLIEENSEQ